jgi:DNA-binding NarL/FixJ family response regulator
VGAQFDIESGARGTRVTLEWGDKMIRVLIADDHQMFAEGLSGALQTIPDMQVVGVLADGSGVAEAIKEHSPDVLLVDLEMPTGGLEVTRRSDPRCRPSL